MEAPPGFEPGMEVLQGTQRLKALREVVCFSAFTRPSTTLSDPERPQPVTSCGHILGHSFTAEESANLG